MAIVNAQRMLDYIRVTTEYIVAARTGRIILPAYLPTYLQHSFDIPCFKFELIDYLQPAHAGIIGIDQLTTSKHPTGIAVMGKGPYINIYNGFDTVTSWAGVLIGSDRISPRLGLAKLFRSAHFPPNAAHPSRP
ncbi:hypothetical protein C8J57DRAFT_1507174 [Mycena rebaudengoi]|nr:hypothetical protein C8J57DRAFT_1507174 [Mycena rebaudengoi]